MDDGAFTILLSTAVASLVLPAVLAVERRRSPESIVVLGLALASVILAGQGYMQLGLLATSPALAFLLLDGRLRPREVWKDLARAGVLGGLMAAPLIIPVLHFLPNFAKPLDPAFLSAPPLGVLPLNLVIRDTAIYRGSGTLGMIGAPAPYTLFIGWLSVLLALFGLGTVRGARRHRVYYLAASAFLVFLMASDVVLKTIVSVVPAVAAVRFPSFTAGLSVPLILGIAAYGLERLLELDWPRLMLGLQSSAIGGTRGVSLKWALLLPLVFNVRSDASYAQAWLTTLQQGDDVPWIEQSLKTEELEWVSPPFGEHYFITPAIVSGLKLSPGLKPWGWKDRVPPIARIEAVRGPSPGGDTLTLAENYGISVFLRPDEHYAAVVADSGEEACAATGMGGTIQVTCDTAAAGQLVVKENNWSGWKAWLDGKRVPVLRGPWLTVDVPASRHTVEFRYLPWDVPLGLILAAIGLGLCGYLWFSRGPGRDPEVRRTDEGG
jgi:uncharacterized integral membrane protein